MRQLGRNTCCPLAGGKEGQRHFWDEGQAFKARKLWISNVWKEEICKEQIAEGIPAVQFTCQQSVQVTYDPSVKTFLQKRGVPQPGTIEDRLHTFWPNVEHLTLHSVNGSYYQLRGTGYIWYKTPKLAIVTFWSKLYCAFKKFVGEDGFILLAVVPGIE